MSEAPLPSPSPQRRSRVRCARIDVGLTQDSRCQVRVAVEWVGGATFVGEGTGNATPQGRANAGAAAALAAVERVSGGMHDIELRGTKLIRAFDSLLVIVALRARIGDRRVDLIGSTVAPDEDVTRGAVLSLLDATNRLLEPHADRPTPSFE